MILALVFIDLRTLASSSSVWGFRYAVGLNSEDSSLHFPLCRDGGFDGI
jgi:hypothetical protein